MMILFNLFPSIKLYLPGENYGSSHAPVSNLSMSSDEDVQGALKHINANLMSWICTES